MDSKTRARQISGEAGVWVVWLHFLLHSKESLIIRMDVLLLKYWLCCRKGRRRPGVGWMGVTAQGRLNSLIWCPIRNLGMLGAPNHKWLEGQIPSFP